MTTVAAQNRTREHFLSAVRTIAFRRAAQGSTVKVTFGQAAASSTTDEGWIHYGRQGWRKGIKGQTIDLQIPARWDHRVHDRGLDLVDGLLTLDAEKLKGSPEGIEVYRATWASQGRGLSIDTGRGLIARHTASGTTYHSTASDGYDYKTVRPIYSTKAAVAGLKRKLSAQAIPVEVRTARQQAALEARTAKKAGQLARLVERVTSWDLSEIQHVVVDRRDSLKAGNCVDGTDAFIERFFPDRDEPRATIGEIGRRIGRLDPAQLAGADLTLARQLAAACLIAIRRDRNARRSLSL